MAQVKKVPEKAIRKAIVLQFRVCKLTEQQATELCQRLRSLLPDEAESVTRKGPLPEDDHDVIEVSMSLYYPEKTFHVWLRVGMVIQDYQDKLHP